MSDPHGAASEQVELVLTPVRWPRIFLLVMMAVMGVFWLAVIAFAVSAGRIVAIVEVGFLLVSLELVLVWVFRWRGRRIVVTVDDLRLRGNSGDEMRIPRREIKRVNVWYAEFGLYQPVVASKGIFVWGTDNRPPVYFGISLSQEQWGELEQSGLPCSHLSTAERWWLVCHPIEQGGTGGIGITRLGMLAGPLVGWGCKAGTPPSGREDPQRSRGAC